MKLRKAALTNDQLANRIREELLPEMEIDEACHIDKQLVPRAMELFPQQRTEARMKLRVEEVLLRRMFPHSDLETGELEFPTDWEPEYIVPYNINAEKIMKKISPNLFSLIDIHKTRCTGGQGYSGVPAAKVIYARVEPRLAGVKMTIADHWFHQHAIVRGGLRNLDGGLLKGNMNGQIIKIYEGEFPIKELKSISRDEFLLRAAGVKTA